jgi:thiaminase|tara:strand:+ start:1349 stop:1573 length:225 start_codon:yes stop_codon:yes gene_type:complete
MNLEEVKKVLVEWEGDAYEVIKNYAIQMRRNDNEITEEFVEQYLGEELYERLGTMIRFFKKFEDIKLKYNYKIE